jgi:glucose/arabinose dehydrogenase
MGLLNMRLLMRYPIVALAGLLLGAPFVSAQPKLPIEDDYYKLHRYILPEGEVLEAGGIDVLPGGKIAVGTRRGEVWIIENGLTDNPKDAKFTRFANGMHEILGLAWKDDWLYVTQRPDISRIKDTRGKGKADTFEVVSDGWEVSGDYHEYAFGSRFDKNGNIWITLCLTGSFNSNAKFRGWAGKVGADGKFIPTTSGVRSPGGIGFNAEGDVFYTDNQGPWNGACGLKQITVGGFVGHPDSFKWYKEPEAKYLGDAPLVPKTKSRIHIEAKRIPQFVPPAVLFPYGDISKGRMGQSASGFDCDLSGGKFGPFQKQLFVGDQTYSNVMRVTLEKAANGRYQGACYPFRQGFGSGIVPVRFAGDGSLIVGGTSRGWAARGNKPFAVERLAWTGKVPFEIHEMTAKPDGFELTFTKEIDPKTAGDKNSYKMETYTYIYRSDYGSPEVDRTHPSVDKVTVGADNKSVRIYLSKLEEGHIHQLTAAGVRSADGLPLLHDMAYYTMNYIPEK